MSGQKTEPPTEKRIKDARKKGQVAKSQDLTQAFLFLTAAGVLSLAGGLYIEELQAVMIRFFAPEVFEGQMERDRLLTLLAFAGGRLLLLLLPLLAALLVVAVAILLLQVGPLFAPKVIKPKPEKLNPIKGFQNLFFKPKTYLELVKNVVKFSIVFAVIYMVIRGSFADIIVTARQPLLQSALLGRDLLFRLLWTVGGIFVLLGVADFFLQKYLHLKELRMSKYEIEKEFKEQEGDPLVKHARREVHEEILSESMMQNVPEADVVVINPTHLAVALRYDQRTMNAPKVTAKGQHSIAQKILKLAKEPRMTM